MKRNKGRNGNIDSQFNEAADALELGDPLVAKGSRPLIRWAEVESSVSRIIAHVLGEYCSGHFRESEALR